MGLVPQDRRVFASLSVRKNLRVAARPPARGGGGGWALAGAFATFPRLAERQHQLAGSLSGGEQQMLAIARGPGVQSACATVWTVVECRPTRQNSPTSTRFPHVRLLHDFDDGATSVDNPQALRSAFRLRGFLVVEKTHCGERTDASSSQPYLRSIAMYRSRVYGGLRSAFLARSQAAAPATGRYAAPI